MSISQCVYNKSGHQIVVIIFLSCIIVFWTLNNFMQTFYVQQLSTFTLELLSLTLLFCPFNICFDWAYNKLFILSIASFEPDEAGGIFGWVTFCLLFLIPWALGSVHYLSLGGGAEKFELLPWGSLEFQDSWGGGGVITNVFPCPVHPNQGPVVRRPISA